METEQSRTGYWPRPRPPSAPDRFAPTTLYARRLKSALRGTRLALQLRSTSDSRVAAARQRHDGHETTATLPGARSANIGRSDMPPRTAPAGCPLAPLPLGSTDSHHRSES